jgi:hypothetical protein
MSERPLTDLDAELRALLSVEPSPEFTARVRLRVADQRMSARWPWVPLSLGSVGVAAAVLVVVSVSTPAVLLPPPPSPPVAAVRGPAIPSLPTPTWPDSPRGGAPRRQESHAAMAAAPSPDVIVDPRQRAAVDALIALTNQGTVLTFVSEPLPMATDIVVEPLNVPPLTVDPPGMPAGAERSDS